MAVQEWVSAVTAPTAVHLTPEDAYLFGLNGCLEHLHCGVTTLVDMSYAVPAFETHEAYIRAILDTGLRGRYSSIISDYDEFGLPPGTNVEGQIIAACRKLGIDIVLDTNFAADVVVMEEGTELLKRLTEKRRPTFTSCWAAAHASSPMRVINCP